MVFVPVVQRISPKLTLDSEIVRRHAGHRGRPEILVHLKQRWMRPDIGTIHGHENRYVAKDLDAARIGVRLESEPLTEELELQPRLSVDFFSQVGFCC